MIAGMKERRVNIGCSFQVSIGYGLYIGVIDQSMVSTGRVVELVGGSPRGSTRSAGGLVFMLLGDLSFSEHAQEHDEPLE